MNLKIGDLVNVKIIEAKAKIAATSMGRAHTIQSKAKIREALIGKPRSAVVRAKISATLSGKGNFPTLVFDSFVIVENFISILDIKNSLVNNNSPPLV